MKKTFKILFAIFLAFYAFNFVNAASVERISPVDNSSLEVFLTEGLDVWETVDADIKVLKDLIVSDAYKDTSDSKKVIISLTYDLQKNNTYSLLGILWTDSNADFAVVDKLSWEVEVSGEEIEKINIINSKTIEVFYKNEIESEDLVYKVLKNLNTKELSFKNWVLTVVVDSPLEVFSSYILLINSFSDSIWADIAFDEVYYEFQTPDYLEEVLKNEVEENMAEPKEDLEAAWEENKGNIEQIAMNTHETPPTWTSTWIILLIAWIITWFFFFRIRKAK